MSEALPPVVAPPPAPAPVPVPVEAPALPSAPSSQLQPSHVAGGGVGGMLGAVIAVALSHYHVHVSDMDAAILGSVCLSAGVGVGHVWGQVGIVGSVKRLLFGSKA